MLSRGVLNGAAINALAVNGDGIIHSASGAALMGMSDVAEMVRRTVAPVIDVVSMMGGLKLTPRRNATVNSLFGLSNEVPFVVWLTSASHSATELNSQARGIVWKVAYGRDTILFKEISEIVIRASFQVEEAIVLNGEAFATHRHGVGADDAIKLFGSGYANTYGVIKGTGAVSLIEQADLTRVVTGQVTDIVELKDMVVATAWYSAAGTDLVNLNAEVQAVRWLPSMSVSAVSMHDQVKAVRTLSAKAMGTIKINGYAHATRWLAIATKAHLSQTGDACVILRRTAAAYGSLTLSAKSNSAKRQPIASMSLLSLTGLMPLPHIYMRPIDDCRTFNIRYEPREISVPEERNTMSYRCCGGTK